MSRYWHKADIPTAAAFVRFWTIADKVRFYLRTVCLLFYRKRTSMASSSAVVFAGTMPCLYPRGVINNSTGRERHSLQTRAMIDFLEQRRSRNDTSDNTEDTIVSRFERQVAAVPDKLALVTDEISLTYRALDLEASRIAAVLASAASQRDQPIMLFMKHEAARIAAMLGALKANRIFISLAPNSPEGWISQVIEDFGAAQIIVDRSSRAIAERVATGRVTVIDVEQLAQSSEPFVADWTASPDDTAFIVYTSGSTGRPKGVAQKSPLPLMRFGDIRHSVVGLGREGRCANLRSSGVLAGINQAFSPLLAGGCLFPFDLHRHGLHKLTPWLIAQKITLVSFSGSLLRTWLASLAADIRFPALRVIMAASEKLYAQDVVRTARHLAGDWRIVHQLTSTETGFIAAQVFTSSSRLPEAGVVPVGRPVDGMEVTLEDEAGARVPVGEIGEIVVHNKFLALGYWNNPELTVKAFRTDPFDNSIRIYRTGDLGRWRADGMLNMWAVLVAG